MTYKYGDWYCKPANEAESKEIIERAVSSGARNIYGRKGSSSRIPYGVVNGCLDCRVIEGTEYTIEQVRKLFPLPGEQTKWDGEGLPPVGTVCEHWWGGVYDDDVEIVQYRRNGNHVVFWRINKDCVDGAEIPTAEFRPLRSEREHWVEQSLKVLQKDPCALPSQLMGMIYDAIQSGELKSPEERS